MIRRTSIHALLLLGLMLVAAGTSMLLTPTRKLSADRSSPVRLAEVVPARFAGWSEETALVRGVVNPQTELALQALYSQTLSRVYRHADGRMVMVSVAYGDDQRDGLQVHLPEVCYPAQGFQLLGTRLDAVQIDDQALPLKRLETRLGDVRPEAISYWTTVGDEVTTGGWDKKRREMRYGLNGVIPDGLIFRVSSIGTDSAGQFALHDAFIRDFVHSLDPGTRRLVVGQR